MEGSGLVVALVEVAVPCVAIGTVDQRDDTSAVDLEMKAVASPFRQPVARPQAPSLFRPVGLAVAFVVRIDRLAAGKAGLYNFAIRLGAAGGRQQSKHHRRPQDRKLAHRRLDFSMVCGPIDRKGAPPTTLLALDWSEKRHPSTASYAGLLTT